MENRAHALAAGLFALLLGAAALFSIWWFSGDREHLNEYELVATGNITGLNPQATVRYRGMSAGKVTSIRIDPADPRNILVRVGIRPEIPITRGTRASLGYQGVTGLAFVQLNDRGEDPTPLTADEARLPRLSLEAGVFDQLTDSATQTLERFTAIAEQLGAFFDERNLARFRAALENLESATTGIDRTFEEAPETLAAIRSVFTPENTRRIASILANVDATTAEAGPTVVELRQLMTRFDAVLGTIDDMARLTGDSLIDRTLPQLERLLADLADTSLRMGRLVDEVEASPQILFTGRSERRPGPGEAGFEARNR